MKALAEGGQPQGNLGRQSLDYLGGTEALQQQLKQMSPEMRQLMFPLGLQQGLGPQPLKSGLALNRPIRGGQNRG
jgi:hypothetical protein